MRMLLGLLVLVPISAALASWPQVLGPTRNGISTETGLNLDWAKKPPKVLWKVEGGAGYGSLAIVENRALLGVQRGQQTGVVCLDTANGKELWYRPLGAAYLDKQRHGPGPRATPTVVDGVVYALMPAGEIAALHLADGKEVWKVELTQLANLKDRSEEQFYWGQSASPLVEGERVIVQPGGARGASIVALERKTGKVAWQTGDDAMGYASPLAIDYSGRRLLIVPTGQAIVGVDPASGKQVFRHPFGNRFDATCSTPAWTGEVLLVSAAYGVGTVALELVEKDGEVSVREKWKSRDLMSLMAPLIVDHGKLYAFHGDLARWSLRCLDIATGKVEWMQNQPGRMTFVLAEGHLWSVTESGTLQLIQVGPREAVVKGEVADVLKAKAWAGPVLLGKRLYLRDQASVVCVDIAK